MSGQVNRTFIGKCRYRSTSPIEINPKNINYTIPVDVPEEFLREPVRITRNQKKYIKRKHKILLDIINLDKQMKITS